MAAELQTPLSGDIRNVKSGVYLYTITSGGLQKTGKVVIN